MEEWREIEGRWVSSEGNAWCEKSKRSFVPQCVLNGYRRIRHNGKSVLFHRLVAIAFLGPPPSPLHTVNHKNRIRSDNRVANLEWASKSAQAVNRDVSNMRNKASSLPVESNDGSGWILHHSLKEAMRATKVASASAVQRCLRGEQATASGVAFRYAVRDADELEGEEWRNVEGIDVSNLGRVKDKHGHAFMPRLNDAVRKYCCTRKKYVHRLVATAFLGPPPSVGATVDHINQKTDDNRAVNLRWATRSEQQQNQRSTFKDRSVRERAVKGTKNGASVTYSSIKKASQATGCHQVSISKCVRGKIRTSLGFEWVYV